MSNVPDRIDAAGQSLDRLWGTNPTDFHARYGEAAVERLMGWKALQGFTPDERAAKMQLADDPDRAAARAKTKADVDKEFESWTPQKAADQLGNFFQRNLPLVHGARPRDLSFGDENTANEFLVDFKDAVRNLRSNFGLSKADAQQRAIEQISAKWKPSALMGGALMKNAPEAYYPMLEGSHDWMQRDLDRDLSGIYGPQRGAELTGEAIPTFTPGWSLRGIIADNQTQREIESGSKTPSYRVHVIDKNGQDQLVPGRMVWDAKGALAAQAAARRPQFDAARVIPPGITGPM